MTVAHESDIFREIIEFYCGNVVSTVKYYTLWTYYPDAHSAITRSNGIIRNKFTYVDHVDYFRVETLHYSRF